MSKRIKKVLLIILAILLIKVFIIVGWFNIYSCISNKTIWESQKESFSNPDHYVEITGILNQIRLEEGKSISLIIDEISEKEFQECEFAITGGIYELLRSREYIKLLTPGKEISIVVPENVDFPGYKMTRLPVVALYVDGKTLLTFEEGYASFMKDFNSKREPY